MFPAKTDAKTIPALADWYKHEFPKGLEKMLALDGPHLAQVVSAFGGFLKLPSAAYAVFCNNHMVHHRGQLSTYLRPMGGKVPAIYGRASTRNSRADVVLRGEVLSLCVVIAGAAAVPLGLRAVNGLLPGAAARSSYLPTIETPRPREPFDEAAATALREAQPEYVVIGDSMAGIRIDPRHLSRVTGRSVAGLFTPGTPVAYWYLQLKNLVADNGLTHMRGAIFFFRDDQLTTQVQVNGPILDRVASDREPELDRVLAAHRLGPLSDVHRRPDRSTSSIGRECGSSRA